MMYLSFENIRFFNITLSFFKKNNFLTYKISYKIKILANLLIINTVKTRKQRHGVKTKKPFLYHGTNYFYGHF
jgi:hypothetical protein